MEHADLRGADFRDANLFLARFGEADLRDALLVGAHLAQAGLATALLRGARFVGHDSGLSSPGVARAAPSDRVPEVGVPSA